uniref:hypothetical protein n=1 Tax=uncultured Citrobacter sp. TaxID=200446 RepID=UPI00259A91A9
MAQAGFILTRHWRDTPQGTEVSFWLATDDGPLLVTLAPQESVAFIPTSQVPRVTSLFPVYHCPLLHAIVLVSREL